ncbi:hypothetical protein FACS189418_0870 [Clostridia bacterium]|nr:hypothetical protein FACS189418_0870 [Clostridia bacterium]
MKGLKRRVVSRTLEIMQAFNFYVIALICAVYIGLFGKQGISVHLNQQNYLKSAYADFQEDIADYLLKMGLPPGIYQQTLTFEVFRRDSLVAVDKTYSNNVFAMEQEKIKEEIKQNILNELQKQDHEINMEKQQESQRVVEEILSGYGEHIRLPYFDTLFQWKNHYRQIILVVLAVNFALFFLLFYLLYKVNRYRHRLFSSLGFSFAGAGLVLFFFPGVFVRSLYSPLNVEPSYMKEFIVFLSNHVLYLFQIIAIFYLLVSIFLQVISYSRKHNRK